MPLRRAEGVDFLDKLSALLIYFVCRGAREDVVRLTFSPHDARHATDVGIDVFEDLDIRRPVERQRLRLDSGTTDLSLIDGSSNLTGQVGSVW